MELKLYNSLTRQKEVFEPRDPKRVTMYNCGPTVYSYAHIGNARAAVVADVLFRVLRHIYGEDHVRYARNITDVDDKIIKAATEQGVDISEITEKYARIYNEDLAALNCLPPTVQPKATDNIGGMIALIEKLIEDGFAYESEGHVFFDVSTFEDYGKLSGNTLDALKKGDRVGEAEYARKKNAADFVLWKPPAVGVGWDAPFGHGRPGWHIECSAMAKAELGETIDIHCGGVDLKFPHHENEIAQSECAHGQSMANYWVHNAFLNMGDEKMSKSLGNVKLIHELLEEWDGEVIRLALLKAHYRSELIWTEALLQESKAQLDGWYRSKIIAKKNKANEDASNRPFSDTFSELLDDLNTPSFLSDLGIRLSSLERYPLSDETKYLGKDDHPDIPHLGTADYHYSKALSTANILGLLQQDPDTWFKGGVDTEKFDQLVRDYDQARAEALSAKSAGDKAKMGELFARSDAIRDELQSEGIVIETGADGSVWRKA